jgi:hypothetical protein
LRSLILIHLSWIASRVVVLFVWDWFFFEKWVSSLLFKWMRILSLILIIILMVVVRRVIAVTKFTCMETSFFTFFLYWSVRGRYFFWTCNGCYFSRLHHSGWLE